MSRPPAQDWLAPVALAFYGASTGRGSFREALDLCASSLGADSAFYYVGETRTGLRRDHHVGGDVAAERVAEYTADWAALNPRQRVWVEVPDGHVIDFDRVVAPADFAATPVWRDFMRLHVPMLHAIGLAITLGPGLQARLGLGRRPESGPFDPAARARLAALGPHLRRAARARVGVLHADAVSPLPPSAFDQLDLAVARYGRDGRFLAANAGLRRLAAANDGLRLGPGGVELTNADDRAALADAIRARGGGARLMLARRRHPVPLVIDVIATDGEPGHVLVLVTDPATPARPDIAAIAALFGLSEAQARLAHDIAAGMTLSDHAAAEGIPLETARSRLKAVLARTACRRQADIAALLARLPTLSPMPAAMPGAPRGAPARQRPTP